MFILILFLLFSVKVKVFFLLHNLCVFGEKAESISVYIENALEVSKGIQRIQKRECKRIVLRKSSINSQKVLKCLQNIYGKY
jgi:hypothetical protein